MGERVFSTGAVRNVAEGKGRYDLIPPCVLEALAKRLELGANEHGEYNFMLGIPNSSLYDSAMRHINQAKAGLDDEPHLAAALTNIAFLIYNQEHQIGGNIPSSPADARVIIQKRKELQRRREEDEDSKHITNQLY